MRESYINIYNIKIIIKKNKNLPGVCRLNTAYSQRLKTKREEAE